MQSLSTGHHIFADQNYTTHKLIEYLSSRNTFYTGTLMTNRKGFPKEMETFKKLGHKESVYYQSDEVLGHNCRMNFQLQYQYFQTYFLAGSHLTLTSTSFHT